MECNQSTLGIVDFLNYQDRLLICIDFFDIPGVAFYPPSVGQFISLSKATFIPFASSHDDLSFAFPYYTVCVLESSA